MAKNQRRRAQDALFYPAPSTTPPDEEKAAERTETQKTAFVQDRLIPKDELNDLERKFAEGVSPIAPVDEPRTNLQKIDPNGLIFDEYGIAGDCTNVPQILKAILCELVRRRV